MATNFTLSDLQKLDQAIASGALRVKYADKEVEYKSTDEMMKVRRLMQKELGVKGSGGSRRYYVTSKGT